MGKIELKTLFFELGYFMIEILLDFITKSMLVCLYAGILSHSGDHRAHSTRSGKQSEIVRSSQPF